MEKVDKKRINIYLSEDVISEIDEYAMKNGISRGGAISVLCTQMLQALNATNDIKKLNDMIEKYGPNLEKDKEVK